MKILRKRNAAIGAVIILITLLIAILAPVISPYDPIKQNLLFSLESSSARHPLGTDVFGRDLLSRIIYGSRVSLIIGLTAVSFGGVIGYLVGIISGYYGKYVDLLIQRLVDILMVFPSIVLALMITSLLGGGIRALIIAIGVANIGTFARFTRGQVLAIKENVYIEAARAIGVSTGRILIYYILPNIIMPVLILMTLRLSAAILIEASLSYLGYGVPPPTASWGAMVREGQRYLFRAPWISIFPGFGIMVLVIGINLFGDGLRDIFDPRLK